MSPRFIRPTIPLRSRRYDVGVKCDFCSDVPVATHYEVPGFRVDLDDPGVIAYSEGPWAACAECAALIDKGDRRGLAERAARRLGPLYGIPKGPALQQVRRFHDHFWERKMP